MERRYVCWLNTAKEFGDSIPQPCSAAVFNGDWVQQNPEYIHIQFLQRAERKGVSLTDLVTEMLLEGQ